MEYIFDKEVHGMEKTEDKTIMMHRAQVGAEGSQCPSWGSDTPSIKKYPGPPDLEGASSRPKEQLKIRGTGVWDSYFAPVPSVDDFSSLLENDPICGGMPLVQVPFKLKLGMHECAPWSVKAWQYRNVTEGPYTIGGHRWQDYEGFYGSMRKDASSIVKEHFHLRPELEKQVVESNPVEDGKCLTMHVRLTDKAHGRKKIDLDTFRSYAGKFLSDSTLVQVFICPSNPLHPSSFVEAYVEEGGTAIYLATDAAHVNAAIQDTWKKSVADKIIFQKGAKRSDSKQAVFEIQSAHKSNAEALVEIYSMARCSFMVHGYSAMSESAFYINPALHGQSVNLDYPEPMSVNAFRKIVAK